MTIGELQVRAVGDRARRRAATARRGANGSARSKTASLAALAVVVSALPALACSATEPCGLTTGQYLIRVPSVWDGRSPLPTLMFLHGHNGSAAQIMADAQLAATLDALGVLLVAPDGIRKSWSFAGKLTGPRDDIAFLESVADDIARRFPIDRRRLVASGFSVGGSMVWYLACQGNGRFSAYAPVAGAFWLPEPQDCIAGPQNLRHIHGTDDAVVPMKGRRVGAGFQQGDVMRGIATWQRVNGCAQRPVTTIVAGMTCERWDASGCDGRKTLMLCLHAGGHDVQASWAADAMGWADELARRGAGQAAAP